MRKKKKVAKFKCTLELLQLLQLKGLALCDGYSRMRHVSIVYRPKMKPDRIQVKGRKAMTQISLTFNRSEIRINKRSSNRARDCLSSLNNNSRCPVAKQLHKIYLVTDISTRWRNWSWVKGGHMQIQPFVLLEYYDIIYHWTRNNFEIPLWLL